LGLPSSVLQHKFTFLPKNDDLTQCKHWRVLRSFADIQTADRQNVNTFHVHMTLGLLKQKNQPSIITHL
jgi:hypothetical protein